MPTAMQTDPTGAVSGRYRVFRAGYWGLNARYCRSAARYRDIPGDGGGGTGLRVVVSASPGLD
jgi:hypothetical protein